MRVSKRSTSEPRADVAEVRELRDWCLVLGPEGGIDQRGRLRKSPNQQQLALTDRKPWHNESQSRIESIAIES